MHSSSLTPPPYAAAAAASSSPTNEPKQLYSQLSNTCAFYAYPDTIRENFIPSVVNNPDPSTVFIGQIPHGITRAHLIAMFELCGIQPDAITDVFYSTRGFCCLALASFKDPRSLEVACKLHHGILPDVGGCWINNRGDPAVSEQMNKLTADSKRNSYNRRKALGLQHNPITIQVSKPGQRVNVSRRTNRAARRVFSHNLSLPRPRSTETPSFNAPLIAVAPTSRPRPHDPVVISGIIPPPPQLPRGKVFPPDDERGRELTWRLINNQMGGGIPIQRSGLPPPYSSIDLSVTAAPVSTKAQTAARQQNPSQLTLAFLG